MISEDGSMIATGSAGGRVKVYDARSGKFLDGFHAQEGDVNGVAFLGGQNLVSTAPRDRLGQMTNSAPMV
jgi:WD40 repeat protein